MPSSHASTVRPRTLSRVFALQILYQHHVTREPVEPAWERLWAGDEAVAADGPVRDFAQMLVSLAMKHLDTIDGLIEQYARQRALHRLAAVDLALLRLGCAELLYVADVPPAVTINEIVELAKQFSAEESSRFINAVLDRVRTLRSQIADTDRVASQWPSSEGMHP
jgi:N utilization substance protein B